MNRAANSAAPAPPAATLTSDEIWNMVPGADEIVWDARPGDPVAVECPSAWDANLSIAAEIADREIVRRLGDICLYDPPITEEEIEKHARRSGLSFREAELELREARS